MSPDHRRAILESGLVDRDWVGAQLGTVLASDEAAVDRYLDGADGTDAISPHPLYEDAWCGRSLGDYLADPQARVSVSPHPVVDVARIVAQHPKAAQHPYGALSWWASRAREDSRVPVPEGVPAVRRGRLRGAALEAAEARDATRAVRLAVRRSRTAPEAEPDAAPLPAPGPEPLVTVVLVVRDSGPRLREAVDAVQAQTYAGWEMVVVDDGSGDDTPAVLAGIAAFEPRVMPMTVPRGGTGRARNAALDKARGTYVAFADTTHAWHPDFLRVMLGHLEAEGAALAHAAMRVVRPDGDSYRAVDGGREHLVALDHVDLAACVVRRDALAAVGGFDESLPGAESLDLLLRLADETPLRLVRRVLLDRLDDGDEPDPRWTARVLERHLVDWETAQHRLRDARRLSIVLHTTSDLDRTVRWVTRTLARQRESADVELVVVGARLPRAVELPLAMLLATYPNARLLAPLARTRPGGVHQPRHRRDHGRGGRARPHHRQPAARRVPRAHRAPGRPRGRPHPAAGRGPAGTGRQRGRGVRPRPHPSGALPRRAPGPRRAGAVGPRHPGAALARRRRPGQPPGATARLRRRGRRRPPRGRARAADGRPRRRPHRGGHPVAARAQGGSPAPVGLRRRGGARAPGPGAAAASRLGGGLGPGRFRGRRPAVGGPLGRHWRPRPAGRCRR